MIRVLIQSITEELSINYIPRAFTFQAGAEMINRFLISLPFVIAAGIATAQDTALSKGNELLGPFKANLQAALGSGMSQGVLEAIGVCQIQAPDIADSLSQDKILVGRSSHRLRNPDNAAPDWVEPIMQSYLTESSDREPQVVLLAGDRLGYVEPITLQPMCTACHGESLSGEVAMRISELYPEDQAVGFKAGDLRGVFWLEYPSVE